MACGWRKAIGFTVIKRKNRRGKEWYFCKCCVDEFKWFDNWILI